LHFFLRGDDVTATAQTPQLRDRLKQMQARVRDLRDERAELVKARDETRGAFAAVFDTAERPTETPEYRRAQAAADRLTAHDAVIGQARDEHVAVLSLITGESGAGALPPGAGAYDDALRALKATPGALLASILERRKADVATLPEHLRFKAAAQTTPVVTDNVNTITESEAVIDLLSPRSVALRSGIEKLVIDTTKTRVPRFTELPEAAWVPELGAFPKNGPGIEMVDSEPPKVGLITELSIEVFDDLRPLTLSMLQTQLLRAVALKLDAGILFGSGVGAEPRGVANTSGTSAVTGVPLTNLAAFAQAIGNLIASNAFPGALAMNALDIGTLLQATEFNGSTNSNIPLWRDAIQRAADGAYSLTLPYFGIPVWPTPAAPRGTALMYDPSTIIAVIRREADIAIDPYAGWEEGYVGLRTYLRADVVVGQPAGAVKIEFEPAP
jgi:HK97 family phage major capsid protein